MARFPTGTGNSGTAKSHVWLTPKWVLDGLGEFDLDPCAAPVPRPWDTARRMITLPDDGFTETWSGRVWLNPPYGGHAARWVAKLADHGDGIALLFGRHETQWFQNAVLARATAILFLRGRIAFCLPDGKLPERKGGGNDAGAPSVLVAYGDNNARALEQSEIRGVVLRTIGRTLVVGDQLRFGGKA